MGQRAQGLQGVKIERLNCELENSMATEGVMCPLRGHSARWAAGLIL
jgi:hypothetical protein